MRYVLIRIMSYWRGILKIVTVRVIMKVFGFRKKSSEFAQSFDLESISELDCQLWFRFDKNDLHRLCIALRIPSIIVTKQKTKFLELKDFVCTCNALHIEIASSKAANCSTGHLRLTVEYSTISFATSKQGPWPRTPSKHLSKQPLQLS